MTFSIAIHGGGVWQNKIRESKNDYVNSLTVILNEGILMARKNHKAIDIAQQLVVMLEDDPLYKAGKGSGSDDTEIVTMDAAIMDGQVGNYGSVTTLRNVKNPILLARHILDERTESMIVGQGAEKIAKEINLQLEGNQYFLVDERSGPSNMGTVGAIVLDVDGNLAAASSTGGFPEHDVSEWRVGDTPIIGSGTLADNRSCAISTCGHGEKFVAAGVARRISGKIEFLGYDSTKAIESTLEELKNTDKSVVGGVICIDKNGFVKVGVTKNFSMACSWVQKDSDVITDILGF